MRNLMKLFESNGEKFAYHVTISGNIPSIKEYGLVPQEPGPEGWPEYDDEDDDDDINTEAFEPRTFAWEDFESAKSYAEGYSTDTVILRFPFFKFNWEDGQTDFRYIYTTEVIPPNFIEVLHNNVWVTI